MMALNGKIIVASSVRCYGKMLKRIDFHAWIRALDFQVYDERQKGRLIRTRKKQIVEENMKVGLKKKMRFTNYN